MPPPPPPAGIGEQLGGLFDQMMSGRAPSQSQLEQVAANLVGKVIGRTVTVEEVQEIRTRAQRGDYEPLREAAQRVRDHVRERRAHPRATPQEHDPEMAARIAFAKDCGRARAIMGFTKDDPLTQQIVKTRYRELARQRHPDVPGGSDKQMERLNWANEVLVKSLQ